jgi:ADP-dependent NAD(P)H-hydrate dehydratase / NAD(P)H-hydrate epimerase
MNWSRQTDQPLFPDILWSRPQNRRQAGKLLVIGGHLQSFSAVSQAYGTAQAAGIGTARVIVPDKLRPMLSKLFPEASFAASTQIGSFSRQALAKFLDEAEWADAVLLAGDFGRNSETAVLLENFIDKYSGQLTLAADSLDYFFTSPTKITDRTNTTLVGSLSQVQKLAQARMAIKQSADLAQTLNMLSIFTSDINAGVVTKQADQFVVGYKDRVSTTPARGRAIEEGAAAYASVWLLQQPGKTFEALTSAAWCFSEQ